jgi:transposase
VYVLYCRVLAKYSIQLPQMNPFLAECSVLVLDNCWIHHNDAIAELVQAAGENWLANLFLVITDHRCLILYLPAYSPYLNPIKESFSTHKSYIVV